MTQKVRTTGGYPTNHSGGGSSKSRIDQEKRKRSKNTSDSSMGNYHNSSHDGNYSYDYKSTKYKYTNMHGKSVTANTSPVASTGRHPHKKQMMGMKKGEHGFSQSQQCSPTLSKSHKLYGSKGKTSSQMSTAYALAQIGKKTYAVPTNLSKSIEKSTKLSSKGSTYKGNTAYYDVLGYNQYNMLMSKKNKKKDSFHHK